MNELRLEGCRSEPLASYLKALGVLRVVGEQWDSDATGRWEQDAFVLGCEAVDEGLVGFLVDEYLPTPVVAPWNGRSGFRTDQSRKSEKVVRFVEASTDPRLSGYRETISAARRVFARATEAGWATDKQKDVWVKACRAELPDDATAWLDAVVVLTNEGPGYPPLLGGAGGVLGSMDLSANFLQRLIEVMCLQEGRRAPRREESLAWARAALFAEGSPRLVEASAGQFDPPPAGLSLVNPWDFVLLIEGSLLFASAVARRLSSQSRGKAAMPFMVDASRVGYPSGAPGERSQGEAWVPLWSRPSTAAEVAHLIGEGRAAWRGRQATTGLDMARAVATLGVDRGIDAFVRHAFVERLGQATLAVPVGRLEVKDAPGVERLGAVDDWLDRFPPVSELPTAVGRGRRGVDAAMFELAAGPIRNTSGWQKVLTALADLEAAVGRSRVQERVGPVRGLAAPDWLPLLDDGTPELRVAAALASLRDPPDPKVPGSQETCLRFLLRPIRPSTAGRFLEWRDAPAPVEGFGARPLPDVLADALARRVLEVEAHGHTGVDRDESPGVRTAFRSRIPAPEADVMAFADQEIDDARVGSLLSGLLLLNWRELPNVDQWYPPDRRLDRPPPPAWALLAPFFYGRGLALPQAGYPEILEPLKLKPEAAWPSMLTRGQKRGVLEAALRRLRMARLDPAPADTGVMAAAGPSGRRLAAALLIPISGRACSYLLRRTVPPQDRMSESHEHEEVA